MKLVKIVIILCLLFTFSCSNNCGRSPNLQLQFRNSNSADNKIINSNGQETKQKAK